MAINKSGYEIEVPGHKEKIFEMVDITSIIRKEQLLTATMIPIYPKKMENIFLVR